MKSDQKFWSDQELRIALLAYRDVMRGEADGLEFSPTALHRRLSRTILEGRSEGAIARRMSNISAAFAKEGRPYSQRYKPSFEHVGTNIRRRMLELWEEIDDLSPTDDPTELAKRTSRAKHLTEKPRGNPSPKVGTATVKTFWRDPKVQGWVLNACEGRCEGCDQAAPFMRENGEPYLEVHHVQQLAHGGPDTVENSVALCPNCHRRLHYSADRIDFAADVIQRVPRLAFIAS